MARNWVFLTVLGFAIGGSVLLLGWWAYHRYVLHANLHDVPQARWKAQSIRSRLPFWRRTSARKEYELVVRHEV